MRNNFILYNEVYTLYLNLFPILKNFPKSEKFTLRQNVENTFLDLLLLIDQYQKSKQKNKSILIKRISYQFDKGKLLIRISHDLHLIYQNNYIQLIEKFELIGKLIGGMLKKL
jgi:hypothetical protein